MEGSFVPECFFDTVLVKSILQTNEVLNHKKGCNEVVKVMQAGKLKDRFAVGVVDKDKKDLSYLKEFRSYPFENLVLHQHDSKPHYVIQLDPPLEQWIINVAREADIDIKAFGLPDNIARLKKVTKSELASESKQLKDLCRVLIASGSPTIRRLAGWLRALKKETYNVDINELING
jgi:hypothetical protein